MSSEPRDGQVAEHTQAIPSFFYDRFGISAPVAGLLIKRGYDREETVERFLYPSMEHLHDPFLFTAMKQVVTRIEHAATTLEKVCVYGDYDADGVNSSALMVCLLRHLRIDVECYIPHRVNEGYGLHQQAIAELARRGVTLIVTVDTGISARDQVTFANSCGIDVLITDHHDPPETLPDALAILNPKLSDCQYPFKDLAGVGVALKVAHACLGFVPGWALQFAAIGTIADMMPLVGENRALVKLGLQAMAERPIPAIAAFVRDLNRGLPVRADDIGFQLAPRINASGRLDGAQPALEYLLARDDQTARAKLQELDRLNLERRELVKELSEQAIAVVEHAGPTLSPVLVISGADWNPGVIGIVASRLMEAYSRSVIVLSVDSKSGKAKGSARAYGTFNMIESLRTMADLFEHFGGHRGAAGMTLDAARIDELRVRINESADRMECDTGIADEQADIEFGLHELTVPFLEELRQLEPFGPGHLQPLFRFTEVRVQQVEKMGKQREHLKLICRAHGPTGSVETEIIAFQQAEQSERIAVGSLLTMDAHCGLNAFRGEYKPQILLRRWRVEGFQLFDWRRESKRPSFRSVMNDFLRIRPLAETAFIVAHHLDYAHLCDRFNSDDLQVFSLDEHGRWQLLSADNHAGQSSDLHMQTRLANIKEVIIYNLPMQPLENWLTALQQIPYESLRLMCVPSVVTGDGPWVPEFEHFGRMYHWMSAQSLPLQADDVRWTQYAQTSQLTNFQLEVIRDVFLEWGLLTIGEAGLLIGKPPTRPSLSASPLVNRLKQIEAEHQHLIGLPADEWINNLRNKI